MQLCIVLHQLYEIHIKVAYSNVIFSVCFQSKGYEVRCVILEDRTFENSTDIVRQPLEGVGGTLNADFNKAYKSHKMSGFLGDIKHIPVL